MILDPCSSLMARKSSLKDLGVQFPGRDARDKISWGWLIGSRQRHLENLWLCATGTPILRCILTNVMMKF